MILTLLTILADRQKLELMAAEGEVNRCRALNQSLKHENQLLERLTKEALWWVQRLEGSGEPRSNYADLH